MLVNLSAADLRIITAYYNDLIAEQYAEIERIEQSEQHTAAEQEFWNNTLPDRAADLARANDEMAFFKAELYKFSRMVDAALKEERG